MNESAVVWSPDEMLLELDDPAAAMIEGAGRALVPVYLARHHLIRVGFASALQGSYSYREDNVNLGSDWIFG